MQDLKTKTGDILSEKITDMIFKTRMEEDKMILVYGHCYTAILQSEHSIEALVTFKDPRKDDEFKDRIISLRKITLKNFPPRLIEEVLKK